MNNKSHFSLWKKEVILVLDGIGTFDLSKEIPENLWRLGCDGNDFNLNNPEINWKIRVEISKFVDNWIKENLGQEDIRIVM